MNYEITWLILIVAILAMMYYIFYRFHTQNNNSSISSSHFTNKTYDRQVKTSEKNFVSGMNEAKNNDQILKLLKKRLLDVLELRHAYETVYSTSKSERYRESSVMSEAIDRLIKHNDNTELINYCASVLDDFDKDREYKYGLREEQIYKTRYIYGSVQSIIESEIDRIETFQEGFLSQVQIERDKIEASFRQQYSQKSEKRTKA